MKKYILKNGKLIADHKYRAFFYTGVMNVGNSIENRNYWDKKYLYHQGFGNICTKTITANSLLQGNDRPRYVKLNEDDFMEVECFFCDRPNYTHNVFLDEDKIKKSIEKVKKIDTEIENLVMKTYNIQVDDVNKVNKINEFENDDTYKKTFNEETNNVVYTMLHTSVDGNSIYTINRNDYNRLNE